MERDQKIQMYHHFIEAVKFANAQKRSIKDPVFNNKVWIKFIFKLGQNALPGNRVCVFNRSK